MADDIVLDSKKRTELNFRSLGEHAFHWGWLFFGLCHVSFPDGIGGSRLFLNEPFYLTRESVKKRTVAFSRFSIKLKVRRGERFRSKQKRMYLRKIN
jgi:hypothetical protein